MKLVKEVMVTDVVCVSPFAKLREALSLMKKHNVKSLVVEKQHPNDAYGLITYTNVLKTVVAEEGDIDLLNVYDACAKPAISVGKSLAVRQVASLMTEHRVKRILVLEDNDLLGFVTMDDIMAVLLEQVE
ncbi:MULTISPECIES: CBS domain-containing protein [Marinobacter]|jgi:signal-transduction protein with cAMP-binding, CBS, and nucleotidyltransferase domain|uniref:CBS domain protein n=3 Tax=Marinobacter TaxID=2742 RepID=A0A137SI78_9GAMM|nr:MULTISPECIES: CBS domain-containing protein [Marinobacter]MDX5440891.1 CBS domain-containing protein [Alteromonadaceae bacterium]AMQ88706.1 histidine kinase [Marinobacter sp. LQ44]KXO12157.1 CBS domain protein [Marinobacter excellens LAMA 842]MAO13152.1 CBS domain-containing protein [Marinobacter sp.]MCD1628819.1 CBS domain-containing protein [Marinobacter shengliensis]|tara:strand:+ start:132 stop:521 length:390 start_codon:yes stop_codon:yes gene_type:complete